MNIKSTVAWLVVTLLAAGCNTMKTTVERDSSFDFATVHTYQWIDGPAKILESADAYTNDDVPLAIDQEFALRHLEKVSTNADVQVAYYLKLKEQKEYTNIDQQERDFSGGFVYNRDSKGWNYEERQPDINVYTVEMGTLALLVYDAKSGKRVWRGTLKTKIDRSRSREEQIELILDASKKLMEKFPVSPDEKR
jgi:hypothetical protein